MTEKSNDTDKEAAPQSGPAQPDQNYLSIRDATSVNVAAYLAAMNLPNVFNQDAPMIIVPSDVKAMSVEHLMPRPARLRKDIRFTEADSFLDYFGAFRGNAHPRIFMTGDDAGIRFLSVFDYAVAPGKDHVVVPLWGDHRAYLELAYHPDYADLRKRNNQWMSQEEFALFVEEYTHLFRNPTGADMLELAQELKGVRNASWQSGKRLANNQVRLEYIETIEARGVKNELIVPEYLQMETPIFKGFNMQDIKAAFSWKMEGDKVRFSYRLLTRIAERTAVEEVKAKLATETKMPLYSVAEFEGVIKAIETDNDD